MPVRVQERGPDPAGAAPGNGVIGRGTGVRVYLAFGVKDMRRGIEGLAALTADELRRTPTRGAAFAFRGKRAARNSLCILWDRSRGAGASFLNCRRGEARFPGFDPLQTHTDGLRLERFLGDLPRRGVNQLLRRQRAGADRRADGVAAGSRAAWRGVGREGLRAIRARVEGGHAEPFAQLSDADGPRRLAILCLASHTAHGEGEFAVGPLAAQLAEHLHRTWAAMRGVAAGPAPGDADFGSPTADPVNRLDHRMRGVVEVDHDLVDQQTDEALFRAGVGARRRPRPRQVSGKPQQGFSIHPGPRGDLRVQPRDAGFESGHALRRGVPALFEGAGHVALRRIDMVVAPFREAGRMARLFQLSLDGAQDLFRGAGALLGGEDCGVDRPRRDGLEQPPGDRLVDPDAAGADARAGSGMAVVAAALVAVRRRDLRLVEDPHHASAARPPDHADEHRPPRPAFRPARRFMWAFSASMPRFPSNRARSM
ncbi:MAG: hypothetical protein EA355_04655 [Rhodobacteraceae bacterium]|nr:MAG: hypothetical protein EA355_04655 [Paracoccaceae bacterium]